AASAPDTRTVLRSGLHSPSSRLTKFTAGAAGGKNTRTPAPPFPPRKSPRRKDGPHGRGGEPPPSPRPSPYVVSPHAADTARNAASQAPRGAPPMTGKIASTPSPINFSTSPPKA